MKLKSSAKKIPIIVIGLILVLLWILPLWTTFLTAFKSSEVFVRQQFWQLPESFHFFNNLRSVLNEYKLHQHFFITLLYAGAGAGIAIFTASLAAYSIVRLKPKFAFLLFFIIYSGTLFPFQMYLIPLYRMYTTLGLYNTKIGMILIYSAICIPFSLFVFRGFYVTMPKDIEDAAKIDGCGPIRSFFFIFLPQSVTPIVVVALFQATWIWNDLLFGMVLTRTQDVRPIMPALAQMSGYGGVSFPLIMTAVLFTSFPTVLLFLLLRKYFIKGLALTVTGE